MRTGARRAVNSGESRRQLPHSLLLVCVALVPQDCLRVGKRLGIKAAHRRVRKALHSAAFRLFVRVRQAGDERVEHGAACCRQPAGFQVGEEQKCALEDAFHRQHEKQRLHANLHAHACQQHVVAKDQSHGQLAASVAHLDE